MDASNKYSKYKVTSIDMCMTANANDPGVRNK